MVDTLTNIDRLSFQQLSIFWNIRISLSRVEICTLLVDCLARGSSSCPRGFTKCENLNGVRPRYRCIRDSYLCDRDDDCGNNWDEAMCRELMYRLIIYHRQSGHCSYLSSFVCLSVCLSFCQLVCVECYSGYWGYRYVVKRNILCITIMQLLHSIG